MREHDGAIPAGWAAGFPGQPHLAVQVFALAGRQGVAVEREAVSAIVHAPAPHGPARRIAQPGGGAHVAVMPPEGNAPFDFLRSRDVVAQAQVQGVLHGVVKARCAKQRARTQGGVQVIPDAVHARARARAGESAVCHAAHGVHEVLRMAFAVLPLQRHGIPQPAVQPRSQAGRKLLAAVVVIHGVLPVAVAVVFEAGRCLKALGLALGHHDGDAHRIARINGGKRTVERIHALQRLHIHHAPARRVKAAQKVGNQIARRGPALARSPCFMLRFRKQIQAPENASIARLNVPDCYQIGGETSAGF